MTHLLVRAGFVVSLVCGVMAAGASPAAADGGSDGGWPPIGYAWCYDIETPKPGHAVVTVCSPV